jgi:hypothetical protein
MYVTMKIFERGRRILGTVFRGMSISVISLILQACYNTMPPDETGGAYGPPPPHHPDTKTSFYGKVTARETGKPIPGIHVSIEETEYWERTDKNGYFSFWVPIQEVFKLKFEDVDGPYNGGLFKELTWMLYQDDTHTNLLIGMDIDTETETDEE